MKSAFFDFYNTFYKMGYLTKDIVHESAEWGVITLEEYKEITGEDYVASAAQ
ncbi:XkdX family protein [Bacillus smithii]|uniref:XkdX family protein n=1 Tax=Bacillus smithii TaxID=1479 RepID=UPI003D1AE186